MKWGVLIALLAGLVAAIYLVWAIGFEPVFAAVARAGLGGLLLLCLCSLAVSVILSLAWWIVVPPEWRLLYSLNPMVGIIDGFRWCIVGGESPIYLPGFAISLGMIALLLWVGIAGFRRIERGFADLI